MISKFSLAKGMFSTKIYLAKVSENRRRTSTPTPRANYRISLVVGCKLSWRHEQTNFARWKIIGGLLMLVHDFFVKFNPFLPFLGLQSSGYAQSSCSDSFLWISWINRWSSFFFFPAGTHFGCLGLVCIHKSNFCDRVAAPAGRWFPLSRCASTSNVVAMHGARGD